ncbi:IS1222-like transposase [Yersinia intermedia]|nr:IS1222-like transposase [Yersinia intermedia]CNH41415.1 IS1222-like transposase [Yersinia intermedia]
MKLHLIQPSKPAQNGLIESFNGCFRNECRNDVRRTISEWRQDYNECCLHSMLNYQTPSEFTAG